MEAVIHFSGTTDLQQDLHSISTWCSKWKLSLNSSKCAVMCFSLSSSFPLSYYLNGQPIEPVDKHKDLGITVCSNLSWSDHISDICAKALQIVHGSAPSSPSNVHLCLYLSLVCNKLTYCSQFWWPHLIRDSISFEHVQRRFTEFLLNDYISDYKARLISLNLLPSCTGLSSKIFCFWSSA